MLRIVCVFDQEHTYSSIMRCLFFGEHREVGPSGLFSGVFTLFGDYAWDVRVKTYTYLEATCTMIATADV